MKKKKILETICYWVLSILIISIFSSRTSPFYSLLYGDYGGNNASHAMIMGKYWLQGRIPYKDLFAMNAPGYVAVQALGWKIGGRNGLYLLEILNLLIYLIYTKKAVGQFLKNKTAIAVTVFSLIPIVALCSGGNSASGWCLGIWAIIIWIVCTDCKEESTSQFKMVALGILAGILPFIQYQSSAIAFAGIFFGGVQNIKNRNWKSAICLLLGFLIPIIVIFSWAYSKNCLADMLKAAFEYPVKAQLEKAFISKTVIWHKGIKCCLVFPLLYAGIRWHWKNDKRIGSAAIMIALCIIIFLMFSNNSWVYFLMAVPTIPLALALLVAEGNKCLSICVMVGVCMFSCIPLKNYVTYLVQGVSEGAWQFYEAYKTFIDEDLERRVMMIDMDSSYLLHADQEPTVKYFALQTELAKYDEGVEQELKQYVGNEWGADVIISQEHRWGQLQSNKYVLSQVYIKPRGNISIYVPYKPEEE